MSAIEMFHQSSQPYNTGVRLKAVFVFFFLLFSARLLRAQEAASIDLSNTHQRTTLRVPTAKEPNCIPQPCVVTRETSVGDCNAAVRPLRVALDRVTPTHITTDPFEVEFRVLNTGTTAIEIPVSPQLSDLQPPGESQQFDYISFALVVRLHAVGPAQAAGVGWVELYGSHQYTDTFMTLEPGHWIRVTAKVKLHTWPSQPVHAVLRGDFWMRKNIFKPEAQGGFVEALDLCPNRTTLPDTIEVQFSPIQSAR